MRGTLSLDQQNLRFSEEESFATVTVIRTDGSEGEVSIEYATANGTASAGVDYIEQSGTLTFGDGITSQTIEIPIINDDILEGNETFTIAVGNEAGGATLGFIRTATITIEDNDTSDLNTLLFSQDNYRVSEDQDEAIVVVNRLGDSSGFATVDYRLSEEYAREGSDYLNVSGTLSFNPGETSQEILVPIINDNIAEPSEVVNIILENPNGVGLEVSDRVPLTIADDDEIPYVFNKTNLVSGLNLPTAFEWIPDTTTMLIAEKDGIVRTFQNGQLLDTPFWDGSSLVNSFSQRGLLSITVHPDFVNNPYVYLGFSIDRDGQTLDGETDRESVVVRVTADANTNFTTIVPDSLTTLLTIPEGGQFHATGDLKFGPDGYLYYTHGDGQDVVRIIEQPELLWSLDRPFSKQFRIDPITGEGLADNPFYDGDPNSVRSKVVNLGIRNSFRFTFHPETGEPVLGDVGWRDWEEINTGIGQNFGWPYFEGGIGESLRTPAYAELENLQEIYDSNPDVTAPLFAYSHNTAETINSAVVLGEFYSGDVYPEIYHDRLFFANSLQAGDVQALRLGPGGEVESNVLFAQELSGVTQYRFGDDGLLYTVDLASGQIDRWLFEGIQPNARDTVTGSDRFLGSPVDDEIIGSSDADRIRGFAGNDLIEGGVGADSISGGEGNDTLRGNGGQDTITGGIGDDLLIGDLGNDSLIGDGGNDTLIGGDGDDHLQGRSGDDELRGGAGEDSLFGGEGNDLLTGHLDSDTLIGGSGNDTLIGGDGNDRLLGQSGEDELRGGAGEDSLFGGAGNDLLTGHLDSDTLIGDNGNDTLIGGDGGDRLLGQSDADDLRGGAGDDSLFGGAGNDSLTGNSDSDTLFGGEGSDTLVGGAGDDLLVGEANNDTLIGGAGNDVFRFNNSLSALGLDILVDFSANDVLQLSRAEFGLTNTTDSLISSDEFETVTSLIAAETSSALIVYDSTDGSLYFNENGAASGFGAGQQFAELSNTFDLMATDIQLIA